MATTGALSFFSRLGSVLILPNWARISRPHSPRPMTPMLMGGGGGYFGQAGIGAGGGFGGIVGAQLHSAHHGHHGGEGRVSEEVPPVGLWQIIFVVHALYPSIKP
jgi:hypothetical protein